MWPLITANSGKPEPRAEGMRFLDQYAVSLSLRFGLRSMGFAGRREGPAVNDAGQGLKPYGKTGDLSTAAGLDAAAVGGQPLSVGQQLDVGGHVSQVSFGQRDHTAAP
jgi:hypothetical protein